MKTPVLMTTTKMKKLTRIEDFAGDAAGDNDDDIGDDDDVQIKMLVMVIIVAVMTLMGTLTTKIISRLMMLSSEKLPTHNRSHCI